MVHTCVKPFTCDTCEQSFARSGDLKIPTSNRKKVIDISVTESFFATRPVSQMSITFFY